MAFHAGQTHAARNRGFNLNIDGNAESCAGLKVRSSNGEIAQVNDAFTLSKGEAPILELNAIEGGQIRVRGWDRADYSVETCKIAVADTRAAAEQAVRGVAVTHSAGRISYTGRRAMRGMACGLPHPCAPRRFPESGS